uniref:PDZ domain-containing protein n=1 Tax=Globisporangium ultimum (strain ATCC 200006 / CBS 805.95 / DAOM BR144) TaxID=431595 RepID=K3WVV0_GLOUD
MESPPLSSSKHKMYDIVWRNHALSLNFTPNERGLPVVCQVPPNASPDVLQSPAAVGDVLIAFQLHDRAVEPVESFEQAIEVLQVAELPITLRFLSRKSDVPERLSAAEISASITFTWQPQQPLGVSLAMDPCSLHTAITRIDPQKISPEFMKLQPKVGDVLVNVRNSYSNADLDDMRFEDIISTLREFPRPSQLTFARLVGDQDTAPRSPPVSPSDASQQQKLQPPQMPQQPHHRPISLASRQSFRIDKPVPAPMYNAPESNPTSSAPTSVGGGDVKKEASKFYKVIYGGGRVGLQLRDCSKEDSEKEKRDLKKSKTKGYSVCIKEVTDPKSAPGLENGSPGDLLMAIGRQDLQLLSFEQVHRELAQIHTPTELLFKKRTVAQGSTGGSLVDALFLFLI